MSDTVLLVRLAKLEADREAAQLLVADLRKWLERLDIRMANTRYQSLVVKDGERIITELESHLR